MRFRLPIDRGWTNTFMTRQRVSVPRITVSFEDTRELFGLSASDAAKVTRLAACAFEQSQRRMKRKAAAQSATVTTASNLKKSSSAVRRK